MDCRDRLQQYMGHSGHDGVVPRPLSHGLTYSVKTLTHLKDVGGQAIKFAGATCQSDLFVANRSYFSPAIYGHRQAAIRCHIQHHGSIK